MATARKPSASAAKKHSFVKMLSRKFSRRQMKLDEVDIEYIMSHTGYTRDLVEENYQQFLSSHPSGVIDPASMRRMLQKSYPGFDTAGLAEHIWRIYDTNLDGEIDFREFMLALCVMGHGSAEDNLKQIFRLFDINSDGKVEKEELGRVVEELSKLGEVGEEVVERAFTEMDADRDGGVTEEEFVQANLQQKGAANAITIRVIDIFVAGAGQHVINTRRESRG